MRNNTYPSNFYISVSAIYAVVTSRLRSFPYCAIPRVLLGLRKRLTGSGQCCFGQEIPYGGYLEQGQKWTLRDGARQIDPVSCTPRRCAMKELGDTGLVTQFPAGLSHDEEDRDKEYAGDLAFLAHQLAQIADELRRSSGTPKQEPVTESGSDPTAQNPAYALRAGVGSLSRIGEPPAGSRQSGEGRADFARQARNLYATRRRRAAIFGHSELFGEPAWDILLDLYVAHSERKPVSVSSACIGSAAPPTTGLRWLGLLAEHDLVMREHDPNDQRRVLVRLTDKGIAAMDEFFACTAW